MLRAALVLGVAKLLRGDGRTGYPLLVKARPLLHASDPSVVESFATGLACGEVYVGHHERAEQSLSDLVSRLRAEGALTALPSAPYGLAYTQFFLGRWRAAYAAAEESRALADDAGRHLIAPTSGVVTALVAGARGRTKEALDDVARAAGLVEQGVESIITVSAWVRGQVHLATGDYAAVIASSEAAGRLTLERG